MELISLKADFAVKELFAHEKVRKQFLSDTLGIPLEIIKSVRLVNPFLRKLFCRQKQGIMDVALELNNDTKIDIEMQVRMQKHWTKRDLYYLARMYTDELLIGEKYDRLPRCISISLLDFELFPDKQEYHSIYRLRDIEGKDLTDLWEVHIIELTKALKGAPVDDWIRLFNAREEADLAMITAKNEGIVEAIRMVKHMSIRKSLRWLYDDYWKAKRDRWAEDDYIRDEGIAIGRDEGITEGMADSILTLLEYVGEVPTDLKEKIASQKDKAVLEQWLLSASKAQSIGQFRQKELL